MFDVLKDVGPDALKQVLDGKPELSWRTAVGGKVNFEFSKRRTEIEGLVRSAILTAIKGRIP